jgi:hypothetical protein
MNWRDLVRIIVVAFGVFTSGGDGGHTHQERYSDPQTRVLDIAANPCGRFSRITLTPDRQPGFRVTIDDI